MNWNEHHGWDDFEAVNDPASGKKLPNEGHATDDWDDFEAVNDPASGKKLPNEGHATSTRENGQSFGTASFLLSSPIHCAQSCHEKINNIYGSFTENDDEYPTLGIVIGGSAVFVDCLRYPDEAIVRHHVTDQIIADYPGVTELWRDTVIRYQGKCRGSSIHIHPMDYPRLSGTDIANYDSLRDNPDVPSPHGVNKPYPVILVNLKSKGTLDLLGFWVQNGKAHQTNIQIIPDDSPIIKDAWLNAQPLAYFSEEGIVVRNINRQVSKDWEITLGINNRTEEKVIKAKRNDGQKILIKFDQDQSFGLRLPKEYDVRMEKYVDWTRFFDDLADADIAIPLNSLGTSSLRT